ncbi:hypothetical protein DICPUDRAFT_154840 [Dictyostelium purpureum]|uniref:C2 NT-type domain-containing protein n=1 Tax=Dictyostelium purpureum TaxID=5786 RepID=F0ZSE6_DICPU|nr:uncharacterized protein DICPUDRAFT_154840 [Dictyostelium purpureum]EGC33146.1 hypothetical protein DICPUDRAFT_154840 [Dictyostelium purpureum]|eukprot:XP_003290341.1 hypothetical protein DICPUDRAFT_154840 [Dictyostelium purpureum]
MPLKLFNKKGGGNQHTVKLKIDLISNVSYAFDKGTEFEIEWKRGAHRGVLPNVYMLNDGDIKPQTQFLIPCQLIKQKSDSGDSEFASKSLIINLRKVEGKKKGSTKISTLQIDLSHMANKPDPEKEKQYSSTMKGVIDQDFKPYIEFTASVYKGHLTPDDFEDSKVFLNNEIPHEDNSVTHSLYSDRRGSISSVSSEVSEYSNIQETTSEINHIEKNPTPKEDEDNSDPFDFSFNSSQPAEFSRKSLRNSVTLEESDPLQSPHETPIFSSDEDRKKNSPTLQTPQSPNVISPTYSSRSESFNNLDNPEVSPSIPQTPSKSKKFSLFKSKKGKNESPDSNQRKGKPENQSISKLKETSGFDDLSSGSGSDTESVGSNGKEKSGRIWKRRHSTPNVGFFSIKSFKEKEKLKEKEKEFANTPSTDFGNLTINETDENNFINENNDLNKNSSLGKDHDVSKKEKKSKSHKKKGSVDSNSSSSPPGKDKSRKNSKEKNLLGKISSTLSSNSAINSSDSKDALQSSLVSRNLDEKIKFIVDDMIVNKRPEYVGNVPLSGIIIYKCLFEWKELSPHNNKCLTHVIETFDSMTQKKNMGKEKSFYWLSSLYTLGFLLEKSYEKGKGTEKSPSFTLSNNSETQNLKLFINLSHQYQKAFWSLYWDNIKIELDKVMGRVVEQIKAKEYEQSPIYMNFLLSMLDFFEKRLPFQSLWPNLFKQIFFYTNGYLVNKYLTDNSISNTNNAI